MLNITHPRQVHSELFWIGTRADRGLVANSPRKGCIVRTRHGPVKSINQSITGVRASQPALNTGSEDIWEINIEAGVAVLFARRYLQRRDRHRPGVGR